MKLGKNSEKIVMNIIMDMNTLAGTTIEIALPAR